MSSGESHMEAVRSAISAAEARRFFSGTARRKKKAAASSVTTVPLKKYGRAEEVMDEYCPGRNCRKNEKSRLTSDG